MPEDAALQHKSIMHAMSALYAGLLDWMSPDDKDCSGEWHTLVVHSALRTVH